MNILVSGIQKDRWMHAAGPQDSFFTICTPSLLNFSPPNLSFHGDDVRNKIHFLPKTAREFWQLNVLEKNHFDKPLQIMKQHTRETYSNVLGFFPGKLQEEKKREETTSRKSDATAGNGSTESKHWVPASPLHNSTTSPVAFFTDKDVGKSCRTRKHWRKDERQVNRLWNVFASSWKQQHVHWPTADS